MPLHYNAFISYKHAPADIAVAKDIQHQLEHYRVPKAVRQKTGREKIERIFRDQEELPITSDLSKDIDEALQDAEFLIVICSSSTKLSTWVPREIARFLEFHDRDHVLTVLVDGEPNEVIPQILLEETLVETDENGTEQTYTKIYEPLSCDYRGSLRQARKTEIPRLAAALLGCSYDELVMRARQYKLRRLTAFAATGGILALGAITYLIWSNRQIQSNYERAEENRILAETNYQKAEENRLLAEANYQKAEENRQLAEENYERAEANYEEAQANLLQARRSQITLLANESIKAFNREERILAVQLALEALPGEGREDWPRMALAEYALTRALKTYTPYYSGAPFAAVWDMEMRGNIMDFKIQRDKNLLYAYDFYGDICAWDLAEYKTLFHLTPGKSVNSLAIVNHGGRTDLLVDDESGISLLDGLSGETRWTFDGKIFKEARTLLHSCTAAQVEERLYVFIRASRPKDASLLSDSVDFFTVCRLDPESGKILWQSEDKEGRLSQQVRCAGGEDGESLYFCSGWDNEGLLYACGPENSEIKEIPLAWEFMSVAHLFEPADGQIVLYGVTSDEDHLGSDVISGTTMLVPLNASLLCADLSSGETVWTGGFRSTALHYLNEERSCWVMEHEDPHGQMRSLLMIIHGQTVRFFDRKDGSLYEEYTLDAAPVSVNTAVDGSMFVSVLRNGNLIQYTLDEEKQYSFSMIGADHVYETVMCFPHNGQMSFTVKTDRTKLQLFEYLFDEEDRDFENGAGYQHLSDTRCGLHGDRYFAVCDQPDYSGPWTVDLYDLESKALCFHLDRPFAGYGVSVLGTDPSGRFLLLTQNMPYQVLVFDTLNGDPAQEPVFCYDPQKETGLPFHQCRLFGDRICLLQHQYGWDKSEVFLQFLRLEADGSLRAEERVSAPLDPDTHYFTQFAGSDEEGRFVSLMQYYAGAPDEAIITHVYDRERGEWLNTGFQAEKNDIALDHLPAQDLIALTDTKKVQVLTRAGELLYTVSDPTRTVEAFRFCPAEKSGLAEDLLLIVTRDEDYRMDRYRASDGSFLGSTDVAYYDDDVSVSAWSVTADEVVLRLDDVINFIDTREWISTGAAPLCMAYSPSQRMLVSREYRGTNRPVWYPRYSLEELIRKGRDFLKGLEMSESNRSVYGIGE
ncbi:MAG: TIR domain-containing protein [Lachnospiraceae bacterium]|nr:TIR domain-containing protein [Lachnospiraceae bacterium]